MGWFTSKATAVPQTPATPPATPPTTVAPPRRGFSILRWWRKESPSGETMVASEMITNAPVAPATQASPATPAVVAPDEVPETPWRRFREGLYGLITTIDNSFSALATPFGVHIRDPQKRYTVLLGVFAGIYLVGALPIPYLPLVALVVGYIGVLAISRAWVVNERIRTDIVKKLRDDNPDELPDLRYTALVSALQLFVLFPLLFMQTHRLFGLFRVEAPGFIDWIWFSLDKTYLKALPDWSILYGVHISSIDFNSSWGRHLVLFSRLTFDYILIQGILRVMTIRTTIREAVAVIKTDPDVAVRVGTRAIPALIDKMSDPDRAVRGAAANVIMQLGDPEGLRQMKEAIGDGAERQSGG